MSSTFPEVTDISTLTGVLNFDQFMLIGVEGLGASPGTAVVATPYVITDTDDAAAKFGPTSSLYALVNMLLNRGCNSVVAVASSMTSAPILSARQTAWTSLEENPDVRIRMTDSLVQADLVALADSCEWAEGIQNKQFAVAGMATGTSSSGLTTAATAIASIRAVLVGPGIYDSDGVLQSGLYSAAYVAAMIALNSNLADDLDTAPLNGTTGIEKAANGMPLFRLKAGAGTPVNDFGVLLAGGVSPLRQGRTGQAEITHLRTTYLTTTTYDSLMTLLIKDQLFINVRDALIEAQILRRPNDPSYRALATTVVNETLKESNAWIEPVLLPDGTIGYGVTVTPSTDERKMKVTYRGRIKRGTSKIEINGVLTIAA